MRVTTIIGRAHLQNPQNLLLTSAGIGIADPFLARIALTALAILPPTPQEKHPPTWDDRGHAAQMAERRRISVALVDFPAVNLIKASAPDIASLKPMLLGFRTNPDCRSIAFNKSSAE